MARLHLITQWLVCLHCSKWPHSKVGWTSCMMPSILPMLINSLDTKKPCGIIFSSLFSSFSELSLHWICSLVRTNNRIFRTVAYTVAYRRVFNSTIQVLLSTISTNKRKNLVAKIFSWLKNSANTTMRWRNWVRKNLRSLCQDQM